MQKHTKPTFSGRIVSVSGQIIGIEYDGNYIPDFYEILTARDNPRVRLEVFSYKNNRLLYCLSLSRRTLLARGMPVVSTEKSISVPVGPQILGRVMNLFGEAQDMQGSLESLPTKSIYRSTITSGKVKTTTQMVETGIKEKNFFK